MTYLQQRGFMCVKVFVYDNYGDAFLQWVCLQARLLSSNQDWSYVEVNLMCGALGGNGPCLKSVGFGLVDIAMVEFGKNFLGGFVDSFNTPPLGIEIHKAKVVDFTFLFEYL